MKQFILLFLFGLLGTQTAWAQPTIASFDNSSEYGYVSIEFSEELNSSTINSSTIKIYSSLSGYLSCTLDLSENMYLEITLPRDLVPGEELTFLITTGVQNSSNVAMASAYLKTITQPWEEVEHGFLPIVDYSTGDQPVKVVRADVDLDGDTDLAVVNFNSENISVLLNNGDGTFAAAASYSIGGSGLTGRSAAFGDINGDGYPDLLVSQNSSSNYFSLFTNDGDGTFTLSSSFTFSTGFYPNEVALADLDSDGDIDLVFVSEYSDVVGRMFNNGSGTFSSPAAYTTGTNSDPTGLTTADFDGDGDIDLATANRTTNTVRIHFNDGSGGFATSSTLSIDLNSPRQLKAIDIDDDGDMDLAIANHNAHNVLVFENTGAVGGTAPFGAFADSYSTGTNSYPLDIEIADFNSDGSLDIIALGDSLYVLTNDSGSFNSRTSYDVGDYARSVAIADYSGKGIVEFSIADFNDDVVTLLVNAPSPTVTSFSPAANSLDVLKTTTVEIVFSHNMDANTLNDTTIIITGSKSGMASGSYSYNDGTNTLTISNLTFLVGELVTVNSSTKAKSFYGASLEKGKTFSFFIEAGGNGNFVYRDSTALSNSIYRILSADIDGDGDEDILGFGNNYVDAYQNNAGSYSFLSQSASPSGFEKFYTADFDHDGDLDLATHPFIGTNQVRFLENNGSGSFSIVDTLVVNSAPDDAVFQDFDGDGNIDIAYIYGAQIAIIQWGINGFNFSGSSSSFGGGSGYPTPTAISYGDVDNDGDLDIIVIGDDKVIVGLNEGSRSFSYEEIYSLNSNSKDVELADFNDDGYLDIVVASDDGAFSILINEADNSGTFVSAVEYAISPYKSSKVTPFDFDGDGDIDLGFYTYIYDSEEDEDVPYMMFAYNINGAFGNQVTFTYPNDDPYYYEGANQSFVLSDIDNDGDLDLTSLLQNDYGDRFLAFAKNEAGSSGTPTLAASSISLSSKSSSTATLTWTNGNGARHLLLIKEISAVDGTPSDNSGYSPNPSFESGSQIGTGNYAVYGGSGNSAKITGLGSETTYHVQLFEFNGIPGQEKFLTTGAPTFNFTTNPPPALWNKDSDSLTFAKSNFADFDLEANQDRIVYNVWLTRAGSDGIYNAYNQSEYSDDEEAGGIEWAYGTTSNYSSLEYKSFKDAVGDWGSLSDIDDDEEEVNLVLHLIDADIYVDVRLHQWTNGSSNGGGFSYTRGDSETKPEAPNVESDAFAGNAVNFTGSGSNYLAIDMESIPAGAFSFETWVKPGVVGTQQVFSSYGSDDEFVVGITSTNEFYSSHVNEDLNNNNEHKIVLTKKIKGSKQPSRKIASTVTVTGTTQVSVGNWYHVTVTAEKDGNLTLYVNGVQEATASLDFVKIEGETWYPGTDYDENYFFTGALDELRIWRTARTVSEIRSYMYRNYTGSEADILAYYQFNEGSGSDITDVLDTYPGTRYNGVNWITSTIPIGSGAVTSQSAVTTGTATVGNVKLSISEDFDNAIDVQVTEVSSEPNTFPSGFSAGIGDKYFVINLFGDPGSFSVNLTLTFGEGVITEQQESDPSTLKLHKRSSNSSGLWTTLGGATSATSATGEVTWNGITSFSQFIVTSGEGYNLIQLADNSDVIAYDDSTYLFTSSFFNLNDTYADTTFTISVTSTPVGNLFLDENDDGAYDDETEDLLISNSSFSYTPSGATKLRYSNSTKGLETLTISLVSTSQNDAVILDFLTVEGKPSLTGSADTDRWYLLANPMSTTIGSFVEELWTQGATNSDNPSGNATLRTFNQATASWSVISSDLDATSLSNGQGLLAYVFADDDFGDGEPAIDGGWPKTLSNYGTPIGTEISIAIANVDQNANNTTDGNEGWGLLGNPYGWDLSIDSVLATLYRIDENSNAYVYRWNNSISNYDVVQTGSISPYEAFWVRSETSGFSGTIDLEHSDKGSGVTKTSSNSLFELVLNHTDSGLGSATKLKFDDNSKVGIDRQDAYYLGSLANNYAHIYTKVEGKSISINSLPKQHNSILEYPLFIDASQTGVFTLDWDATLLPEGWNVVLVDLISNETVDLMKVSSYSFSLAAKNSQVGLIDKIKSGLGSTNLLSSEARFMMKIQPAGVTTAVEGNDLGIPTEVELSQNFPNPFNPSTNIKFGVPEQAQVRLEVFDILGRKIRTLVNESKKSGRYNISFDARNIGSGVYFYRLSVGSKVITKRMTLIK